MVGKRFVSVSTTAALLACQVLGGTACGVLFVHGPPTGYQGMRDFSCTESIAGPALDFAGFVWFTINGTINSQNGALVATIIDAALTVAYSMSTIVGVNKVRECKAARAGWTARPASGQAPITAQPLMSQPAPRQPTALPPTPAKEKTPKSVTQQPAAPIAAPIAAPVAAPIAAPVAAPAPPATPKSVTQQPAAAVSAPSQPAALPAVHTVVVSPAADSLSVGQTVQLTAVARTSSGAAVPYRGFAWRSSHRAVASVTSSGLVTARAAGVAVITATTGGVAGRAKIVVVKKQ